MSLCSVEFWTAVAAFLHVAVITITAIIAWKLANKRIKIADQSNTIAARDLRYQRYHEGARLLGDPQVAVRLSGALALWRLARSYPKAHHLMVMDAFAAYLSYPASFPKSHPQAGKHDPDSPESVKIIEMINCEKSKAQKRAEHRRGYQLKLANASPYCVDENGKVCLKPN